MNNKIDSLLVVGVALIVAWMLFSMGLGIPLPYRVRGDAYQYLAIASQFTDWKSVLVYAGDRTVGVPFFEYLVKRLALWIASSDNLPVLAWVNAICTVLFAIHLVCSWLFSRWVMMVGWLRSPSLALGLFFFLASYPPLIGHTTAPLSDTLAVDLLLAVLLTLHQTLYTESLRRAGIFGLIAALGLGLAILVRPGNLLPIAIGLLVSIGMVGRHSRRLAGILAAVALVAVFVLLPFQQNCMQKFGTACLQSPSTFNFIESAQAGLRGARILWQQSAVNPGHTPILPDDYMYRHFAQSCQLQRIIGTDNTSLTGCLLLQPLAVPKFLLKKWIGLFDHYRFTPYLEDGTPSWLVFLTRTYDSLTWVGFCVVLTMPLLMVVSRLCRTQMQGKLVHSVTPVFLIAYSITLLAQHTVLHTEDRYGFPLIPLSAAAFFALVELTTQESIKLPRKVVIFLCALLASVVFIAQVMIWDKSVFY